MHFELSDDADIFELFRAFVARAAQLCAASTDPLTLSLVATGRLLTADLAAAEVILEQLPSEDFKLDHGAGICVLAALRVLCAALPLPTGMPRTERWLAGLPEPAMLQVWLAEHHHKLRWLETQGLYLPRPGVQPGHTPQYLLGPRASVTSSPRAASSGTPGLVLGHGVATLVILNPRSQREVSIPLERTLLCAIDWDDCGIRL
jgi:hypothetical protein